MDLQLKGKTAIVSGSTAGIGLAIAKTLADEGAKVVVNGRTQARVDGALKQIGPNGIGVAADLSTPEGAALLFERVPEADILVNNLGIFEPKSFVEITDEDWERFFRANVLSGVRLSRFYFPKMKAKNWGRVIFISSESALNTPAEMIHYGMTKTAQLAVARGLAQLTAGTAVTVNSILVGPTLSEGVGMFLQQLNISEAEFFIKARPSSLLKRFEMPAEVASAVAFVASPLASAINGSAMRVEGGVIGSI
jgi:NAD(P)-dependent dehydrogenase (short-subunit alcohol dehydrogenase family)